MIGSSPLPKIQSRTIPDASSPLQSISITGKITELIKLLYPDISYINSGPRNTPGLFFSPNAEKKGVYGI